MLKKAPEWQDCDTLLLLDCLPASIGSPWTSPGAAGQKDSSERGIIPLNHCSCTHHDREQPGIEPGTSSMCVCFHEGLIERQTANLNNAK